MSGSKSTPEQKRKRLLYLTAVVIALFLLRVILVNTGVISGPKELPVEELTANLSETEALVSAGKIAGHATIMQVSPAGKKKDTDTVYLLTTYEIAAAAKELDGSAVITFGDGTSAKASFNNADKTLGIGVLECEVNGKDSVYFSENVLYQMQVGTPVVFQEDQGNQKLAEGSFLDRSRQQEGFDENVMLIEATDADIAPGTGIYAKTGYWLGLALSEADGSIVCAPGNTAVDYFRTHH
ncbi:hypothetical protein SAMN02745687_01097 [Lachnospiraceae bacterium NK3A20]|nr:hypothetical protein SAMN02745687_01097 [Lachnospiraceae bacterium NK3A20]